MTTGHWIGTETCWASTFILDFQSWHGRDDFLSGETLGSSVPRTAAVDWPIRGAHRPVCSWRSSIRLQKFQNAHLKALKTNTCCAFEPVCRLHLQQRWQAVHRRLRKKHYSVLNRTLNQDIISNTRKQMYAVGSGQQSWSTLISSFKNPSR